MDLEIDKAQAIGHLHYLWWWALEYKRSGNLAEMTSQEVASAAEWTKNSTDFLAALKKNGWLEENGKLHDWKHYSGKWISSLARQKRYRKVTSPLHNALHNRYVEKASNLTIPNLTKHNLTIPETTPLPPNGGERFELIWQNYPNKDGRKAAEKHFRASVKSEQDWMDIQRALENYLGSERVVKGFIKNGSTWFNNWRDWAVSDENKARLVALSDHVKAMP